MHLTWTSQCCALDDCAQLGRRCVRRACTRRGRCGARLVLGESSSSSSHLADVRDARTKPACSLEGCMHGHGPGARGIALRDDAIIVA